MSCVLESSCTSIFFFLAFSIILLSSSLVSPNDDNSLDRLASLTDPVLSIETSGPMEVTGVVLRAKTNPSRQKNSIESSREEIRKRIEIERCGPFHAMVKEILESNPLDCVLDSKV